MKYLGTTLTKDMKVCMLKTINNIAQEIKEFPNKWRAELYSWVRRLYIVKVNIIPRLIYRFNIISINMLADFLQKMTSRFKILVEMQRTQNSQKKLWKRTKWMCFSGGSMVKNLPASAGNVGLIPGLGKSPEEENGNALPYSCLGNPMDRGAWRATAHGIAKQLDMTQQLNNSTKVVSTTRLQDLIELVSKIMWHWSQIRQINQ